MCVEEGASQTISDSTTWFSTLGKGCPVKPYENCSSDGRTVAYALKNDPREKQTQKI